MSRWKSPNTAARRAEREAERKSKLRRDKRRGWLLLVGFTVIFIGLMVADYFWLRHRARQRHERLHHHIEETNSPATNAPPAERNEVTCDE
jgi:hypothetical protein